MGWGGGRGAKKQEAYFEMKIIELCDRGYWKSIRSGRTIIWSLKNETISMCVSDSLTDSLTWLYWCDPGEWAWCDLERGLFPLVEDHSITLFKVKCWGEFSSSLQVQTSQHETSGEVETCSRQVSQTWRRQLIITGAMPYCFTTMPHRTLPWLAQYHAAQAMLHQTTQHCSISRIQYLCTANEALTAQHTGSL